MCVCECFLGVNACVNMHVYDYFSIGMYSVIGLHLTIIHNLSTCPPALLACSNCLHCLIALACFFCPSFVYADSISFQPH